MDWKEKIRDLSTSLNNFGSLKNIQRGAAAFGRRPPLYVFWLPKFFELLLKVSYFFLSIHFGLQGLSKITFWGPWTYLTNNSHCKLRNLVALRGQKSKKNGYLRIQGRMQIFEKKSPTRLEITFWHSRTLELDESFRLMCCTSPELRSASSYGHFTAAKEFRSQCHILSLVICHHIILY